MADNRTSVALSAPPHGGSLEGRVPGDPQSCKKGAKGVRPRESATETNRYRPKFRKESRPERAKDNEDRFFQTF